MERTGVQVAARGDGIEAERDDLCVYDGGLVGQVREQPDEPLVALGEPVVSGEW